LFFYVLMGYIFIAFVWWMLLLMKISNESFTEKRDLLQLNYSYRNQSNDTFEHSNELKQIEEERKRKIYMIFGEGSFFLAVLIVMTWMMHRSLRREAEVAQQQKNFLLSITHEFRSPIASSKVAMQTLEKYKELPEEKRNTLLNNSLHDMERLQGLVENLLLAAKIEDHNFSIGHEACDLSEIVSEVVQKLKVTTALNRKFVLHVQPEIVVIGDRIGLTSVITNLVENAIKYSADDSSIAISLNEENNQIVFRIADNGLGIPDREKKKIFHKFYRVGHEETRKTKGTGLGLYIVKKILSLHQGSVNVKDNQPKGTIFEVALPK
jgi:two-component system phosphate regulon sensor histidine kinase PhoR